MVVKLLWWPCWIRVQHSTRWIIVDSPLGSALTGCTQTLVPVFLKFSLVFATRVFLAQRFARPSVVHPVVPTSSLLPITHPLFLQVFSLPCWCLPIMCVRYFWEELLSINRRAPPVIPYSIYARLRTSGLYIHRPTKRSKKRKHHRPRHQANLCLLTPVRFSTSAKPSKSCLPMSSRTSSPSRRRGLHQRTVIGTSPPAARLAFHLSTHLEQPAKEGEWRFSTSLPSPSVGTPTPTPPHSSCSIAHFRCGRRFDC